MGARRRERPRRREKKRKTGERRRGGGEGTGLHRTRGAEAALPEEDSAGEGTRGVPKAFPSAASRPVSCISLFLSLPGNRRRKEGYRRAPNLFPAPLADMAADELSQRLLRSPAGRVEETPLAFPPRLLLNPPGRREGGRRPATAEHRARTAREEAQRADDHRVRVQTPPRRAFSLRGRPLLILRPLRRQGNGSDGKGKTERSFAGTAWSVYFRRPSPGVGLSGTWGVPCVEFVDNVTILGDPGTGLRG